MPSLALRSDVASAFFGLAYRNPKPFTFSLQTTLLPLLRRTTTTTTYSLSATFPLTPARRFSLAATASASAPPQSDDSDVSTAIPPDNRIPATIITGFLGSGKTTLLNHILTAEHGKRIAVIENEFGEVDIDGSLVAAKAAGAEDIMMLNNGCLCCTVRGDLVRMISELVAKKKGKFDHIVIETTGLANPAPIIQTFYAEENIFNEVKLDGVVTLVDAKHAGFHLDEVKPKGVVNEAVEQIAYADRIIVNKTDLVGESDIASLVQRIKNINGLAHLKRTEYGKVNLDYVLGIGGFDLERIENAINDEDAKEDHGHDHSHDHEHEHHDHDHHHHHHDHSHDHKHEHHDHHSRDHSHDPGVSSVSIVCEGSLDLEKANMWLGTLLLDRSEDIYRMKGLLSVQGMDERFVFQGVHDIFQGSPERLWGPDEPRINKIVFIGKNLDAKELEKGFKACLL
ncbi:COBW domain-containing protein 1 [Cajanus cajan]|uniref:COBW domain-containing protein 1 n=1 Tax=Cajanus cajan TaxID=3821 RepID=A0A151U838_CAJCA|nr:COBW domain-containing protein 1 [Cajanus cajan]XP_020225748.1 COBW domain-containing protein 1 [Cajanus cajan]KYP75428.1 COBW domain-containing protein 1 [Cajanus cajan]